jgi:hypothetical protein
VTLKAREGVPSLRTVKLVRELERSFAANCERNDFRLVHYSIQPAVIPVAFPRSWLLGVGWKRSGLLDPDAIPRC